MHETHQGISFENWLDLFLDYAIGLAVAHRRDEAYQVCEAARDSTVFQSSKHEFIIHVAWGGKPYLFFKPPHDADRCSVCHLHQ